MLRELVELAKEKQREGVLPPTGYKLFSQQSPIRWVIHLKDGEFLHLEEIEITDKPRPIRQRSGKVSPKNVKPYLLVDEARVVLGKPEPGKERDAELLHEGFKRLLKGLKAYASSRDPQIAKAVDSIEGFLSKITPNDPRLQKIDPKDVTTFAIEGITTASPYLFEEKVVQDFWKSHIAQEFSSEIEGTCGVCEARTGLLQTLPMEVVVDGQKCQITSFNLSAFESFGKKQTTNATLCFSCGIMAAQALNLLLKDERHRSTLVRKEAWSRKSPGSKRLTSLSVSPLHTQVALYWLKLEESGDDQREFEINLLDLFSQPLAEKSLEVEETLASFKELLKTPWKGTGPLELKGGSFHLAVISANKGRLVLREWIGIPIDSLRERLTGYASALSITGPKGEHPRFFPIPVLLDAVKDPNPNTLRGLIRTAYLGALPPPGLLESAVRRIRIPNERAPGNLHPIMAALKLSLTFGKEEEMKAMESLNPKNRNPAYLSGRLLAVLEEIQLRAANWRLNASLVDRFYGSASTSPATTFPVLIKLAETGHLPKLRKSQLGYQKMRGLLEEILSLLDEAGGFPSTLPLKDQGLFALGFYHQRAALSQERGQKRA